MVQVILHYLYNRTFFPHTVLSKTGETVSNSFIDLHVWLNQGTGLFWCWPHVNYYITVLVSNPVQKTFDDSKDSSSVCVYACTCTLIFYTVCTHTVLVTVQLHLPSETQGRNGTLDTYVMLLWPFDCDYTLPYNSCALTNYHLQCYIVVSSPWWRDRPFNRRHKARDRYFEGRKIMLKSLCHIII